MYTGESSGSDQPRRLEAPGGRGIFVAAPARTREGAIEEEDRASVQSAASTDAAGEVELRARLELAKRRRSLREEEVEEAELQLQLIKSGSQGSRRSVGRGAASAVLPTGCVQYWPSNTEWSEAVPVPTSEAGDHLTALLNEEFEQGFAGPRPGEWATPSGVTAPLLALGDDSLR